MRSLSFAARRALAENSRVLLRATIAYADGTSEQLSGDDFMMGTARFSSATSSSASFDVGAAVVGTFSVSLNNRDQRFDSRDFADAEISPSIGVPLGDGVEEWLAMGVYTAEQPETYGNTISIDCVDRMGRFDRPYSDVTTRYPATMGRIVADICTACGMVLATSDFAGSATLVQARPDNERLTCRAMLSYVAQATGNYAQATPSGQLALAWYDTAAFEEEDWLDGGSYDTVDTPYSDGDAADGGSFASYDSGDAADGGSFVTHTYATLTAVSQMAVFTDDVVITGVRVTAADEHTADGSIGDAGESALFGTEGYVLSISDNPLIEYGKAAVFAEAIGARVVGMRFRPFDVTAVGNPAIEAGDPVVVIDSTGRAYRSYLTSITYKLNAYEAYACGAESPGRHRAGLYSAVTEAIVRARHAIRAEQTSRELAVAALARELAESGGLYMTQQEQEDHSIIYYMHDKPTLAESRIVWKLTANAFGISTDGGRTYPYGLDVNGDAILNRVYAIGLDASYINAGRLEIRDPVTLDTVFVADVDTGEVSMGRRSASSINGAIDDAYKYATSYITDASNGITIHPANQSAAIRDYLRIDGRGLEIYSDARSRAFFGLQDGLAVSRVGLQNRGNVLMTELGSVAVRYGSTTLAYFGYADGKASEEGVTAQAPYYTMGRRADESDVGNYSTAIGVNVEASGYASLAQGSGTVANRSYQAVFGRYNEPDATMPLIVGNGTDAEHRHTVFAVSPLGGVVVRHNAYTVDSSPRNGLNPDQGRESRAPLLLEGKDGARMAGVWQTLRDDGSSSVTLYAFNRTEEGDEVYNSISAAVAKDGTRSYGLADANAFRVALGADAAVWPGVWPVSLGGTGSNIGNGALINLGVPTNETSDDASDVFTPAAPFAILGDGALRIWLFRYAILDMRLGVSPAITFASAEAPAAPILMGDLSSGYGAWYGPASGAYDGGTMVLGVAYGTVDGRYTTHAIAVCRLIGTALYLVHVIGTEYPFELSSVTLSANYFLSLRK